MYRNLSCKLDSVHQIDLTFAIVRFGSVLNSSGSVIPIFRSQIAKGGPVTVTDPQVTRFFMTIVEASQLIIRTTLLRHRGMFSYWIWGNQLE